MVFEGDTSSPPPRGASDSEPKLTEQSEMGSRADLRRGPGTLGGVMRLLFCSLWVWLEGSVAGR